MPKLSVIWEHFLSQVEANMKTQFHWKFASHFSGTSTSSSTSKLSPFLSFFFFSLGFTFNFHLSEYALIPVIELKLAMVLIHILYKKQYTLFPNICAVTKIPVHNPMGTDF